MGNLARDPELRYTPQGTAVSDLRLAVTTIRGGKGQERKEETVFIDATVWGRQAENCSEYLSKGRPVLVEGRLAQDNWEDKETGQKRSKIKVIASSVQFLGGREGSGGGGGGGARRSAETPGKENKAEKAPEGEPLEEEFQGDEEIPF
jgi:single-strand DNA-binding protein